MASENFSQLALSYDLRQVHTKISAEPFISCKASSYTYFCITLHTPVSKKKKKEKKEK